MHLSEVLGEQLSLRVSQKLPESGTSSLHGLGTGYSSQLHPNATDTKNSPLPPAVGQPLLHPNPMESSRVAGRPGVLFSPLPVRERSPGRRAGGQASRDKESPGGQAT